MNHDHSLERCVDFFQELAPDTLSRIDRVYAPDACFRDPFNEVSGIEAIKEIYRHMFEQVEQPHFLITARVMQGNEAFLTWDFLFHMKRWSSAPHCIRGATHLRFGPDGRIQFHRDYWDVAEELYEKIPLLGGVMRVLKRAARR
jgi:steroid Delta-isomerase